MQVIIDLTEEEALAIIEGIRAQSKLLSFGEKTDAEVIQAFLERQLKNLNKLHVREKAMAIAGQAAMDKSEAEFLPGKGELVKAPIKRSEPQ